MFHERDWKLFRKKIGDWQENYMDKLNREYIKLLAQDGNPSEKFWALEKRLRSDNRKVGVQAEMSRSMMLTNISALLREGAITLNDLEPFSDDLKGFFRRKLE